MDQTSFDQPGGPRSGLLVRTINLCVHLLLAVAASLALSVAHADEAPYRLQAGDTIEVWVGQDPSLNRQVIVQPDGRISMPLAGHVRADGLSLEQLEEALAERLRGNFKESLDLTVMLVSSPGQGLAPTIFLVGDVAQPGQYPFRRGMTVLHAVSVAGGPYRPLSALSQLDPASADAGLTFERRFATALLQFARLTAELDDRQSMTMPPEISASMQDTIVASTARQEELLFEARRSSWRREVDARKRAISALRGEITAFRAQLELNATQKTLALQEQASAKSLIDKGLTPAMRGMELQRSAAEIDATRVQVEASLRKAEEELAGGEAEASALEDERRLQLLSDQAKANAEAEELRRLLGVPGEAAATGGSQQQGDAASGGSRYSILRTEDGVLTELEASELTPIQPGDLIKVRTQRGMSVGAVSAIDPPGASDDAVASSPQAVKPAN